MYTIQANPSGTRSIEVSNENLRTIEKYALFRHLIDSTVTVGCPPWHTSLSSSVSTVT